MALIELDLLLYLPPLVASQFTKVELVAECAEHRYVEPRRERYVAECLLIRSHRDVSRYCRLRIEGVDSSLYVESLESIGIVARPYLWREAEHTEVETVAA